MLPRFFARNEQEITEHGKDNRENRECGKNEVYKHFKGNLYVVLNVARHTETNELFVVYAATKEMQRIYARPLEMFMSEVDREKYPDAKQTYRFENMMEG